MSPNIKLSIIVVHYKVKKELFECIRSILASHTKISYEIIVVDNDEIPKIGRDLKKKFPNVTYVPNENNGYGGGNNRGAKYAKGKYLFILNPDTILEPGCIDILINYLQENGDVAIAAPLLYDKKNNIVPLQGVRALNPINAIFSFSFVHRLFKNNPIFRHFGYFNEWDKSSVKEVQSISGAAFIMRKKIFEKIKGFDEKFFLYFEEYDLCKRVVQQGHKIVMCPKAKVRHALGKSTQKSSNIEKIFMQSRFYYFKKHFGLIPALFTEMVLRINKYNSLLLVSVFIGFLLRTSLFETSMPFLGDQAWFYLSARDMVLTGKIPLVGIASSHPWLHQGALWTYVLAGWLWIFHFNPISGGYLSALIDCFAIGLFYKLGSSHFSKRVGLIAATLYTFSPLVIMNARMPYHTSPIPLFVILSFYCFFYWIKGHKKYFPFLILNLVVLYNFELATFLFSGLLGIIVIIALMTKKQWARAILTRNIMVFSLCAFLLPMLPMFLYDITHGFPQTLKFLEWVGYRILVFFGLPEMHPTLPISSKEMLDYLADHYKVLVFPYNNLLAIIFFTSSLSYAIFQAMKRNKEVFFLLIINLSLVCGIFAIKGNSEAYMPMLFPGWLLLFSFVIEWLLVKPYPKPLIIGLLVVFFSLNFNYLKHYSFKMGFGSYAERLKAAKYIVKEAGEKEYNLKGEGKGSKFDTFTMNYEYFAWWLGHGPSSQLEKLQFIIREENLKSLVKKIQK